MNIIEIAQMPTTTRDMKVSTAKAGTGSVHESVFRAFHILEKTKELLSKGTPPDVVLTLIGEMESYKTEDAA